MDPYLQLAKSAVETYIKKGETISPLKDLPKKMLFKRAGVFVSIHKILTHPSPQPKELRRKIRLPKGEIFDGLEPPSPVEELRGLPRRLALATRARRAREQVRVLRGCIGTYLPTCENIGQEIIKNAIDAATSDPRFPPVTPDELPHLKISVDILSQPKLVMKNYSLNPKVHGLIVVAADGRRALLLPDLPGVDTSEQQIEICRRKANIAPNEPITLQIFTVERHEEGLVFKTLFLPKKEKNAKISP